VEAVQSARVLDQRSLPRHRQRQKEGVEPSVVEAFADVSAGGEHEALLGVGNRREPLPHHATLPGTHSTLEHDKMSGELLQLIGEILEVILALGQQNRRPPLLERVNDIIQDEPSWEDIFAPAKQGAEELHLVGRRARNRCVNSQGQVNADVRLGTERGQVCSQRRKATS
jgi:hypothetical protein